MIWSSGELPALLQPYRGLQLLGTVDGGDCLEVVFSEPSVPWRPNLLCLYDDGGSSHGSVADPERYVLDWRAAA